MQRHLTEKLAKANRKAEKAEITAKDDQATQRAIEHTVGLQPRSLTIS